ncbi:hypothetical protein GEMRC1_004493 [Eukaryota sp. GEM-RC1]
MSDLEPASSHPTIHLPHVDILGRPLAVDVPEVVEDVLELNDGTVCCFNPSGSYIAVGHSNGLVSIVDYFTRSVATVLNVHTSPISTIEWSNCSFFLLVGSEDGSVTLWNAQSASLLQKLSLNDSITSVSFSRSPFTFIVSSRNEPPRVISLDETTFIPVSCKQLASTKSSTRIIAQYTNCGNFIYIVRRLSSSPKSSSKLSLLSLPSYTSLYTIPINSPVSSLVVSPSGNYVLLNCDDHRARLYKRQDSSLVHCSDLHDAITHSKWSCFCFSPNDEYVLGSTLSKMEASRLFLWNVLFDSLIKTFSGPKEGVKALTWHPLRPIVGTINTSNLILLGPAHEVRSDRWKRFLPNFDPLEENIMFQEPENQFDEDYGFPRKEGSGEVVLDKEVLVTENLINRNLNPTAFKFVIPLQEVYPDLVFKPVRTVEAAEDDTFEVFQKTRKFLSSR